MEKERKARKCSACGGETVYVHDVALTQDKMLVPEWTLTALYRCPDCGHFDLYEREEERQARERAERYQAEQEALPDYRCPSCLRVGKWERCPFCRIPCEPVDREAAESATEPERRKKRRWFGRDDDKPDWEG